MDYGNQSQPVTPALAEAPPKGRGWLIFLTLLLVLGLVAAGLAWWWLARPSALPTSLGFTDRAAITSPNYLDQTVAVSGSCLTSYILQASGRNEAAQQTYFLTFQLVADPTSDPELASALANPTCQTELTPILEKVAKDLDLPTDTELLTVSYLTKSGRRLLTP